MSELQTSGNRRVGLLVPDGVGVRNFVLGPFLKQLSKDWHVHNLHVIPEDLLGEYRSGLNGNVHWHSLLAHRERPLSHLLRQCLSYAQMHWVDSFAMRYRLSLPVRGSWRRRASTRFARFIGRAAASPRRIRMLDRLHAAVVRRRPEVEYYRRQFRQIRPSALLCSHQRPTEILAPVLAARSLGIPTATFIFSWDNLTSKGRIAAPFEHFLVWSEQMRRELLELYPDVAEENVHLVGTPQFDPYADESLLWPREEFFGRLGLDPNRPLICYSGGDAGNAPEDPQHVAVLMEHIRCGRIKGKPQVLLRPTPVDEALRYQAVCRDYPELVYRQPAWRHTQPGNWAAVIPRAEDIRFMANLTRHADLNVNFGSTMTLDFAIHDKPVVNVAFDVGSPPPFGITLWEYQMQFEHYHPVIEFGAARFARSAEELAEHVNAYLDDPTLDAGGRRKFVEREIGVPIGQSSGKIIEALKRIAR